jgi:cytochrome bd ubiquinol oxidase subunit II
MSQTTLATLSATLILLALIAYAVLGGADFGGGIWDLLARGPTATRQRAAIAQAMGPVWESNNVWLIFVLVVTWTAFPIVYASVSAALFIPITLVVIGIVLRGASFSFRSNYGLQVGSGVRWGHVFDVASAITPFLLGTVAGALASGGIRVSGTPVQVQANIWTTWTTPFALSCGAFALGLCAVLSAIYLTVETRGAGDRMLADLFRRRGLIAGAVTAVIGIVAALLARGEAPVLWQGLTGKALPLMLGAVLIGLATGGALLREADGIARILVAAGTACIFVAWGVAQWPDLIVPDVTIDNAASPSSVLAPLLVVSLIGLAVLLPALWYLFYVVKLRSGPGRTPRGPRTRAGGDGTREGAAVTTASFVASLQPPTTPTAAPSGSDTFSARASSEAAPAPSVMQRAAPMLAVLIPLLAAPLLTSAYDSIRQRLQHRRQVSERHKTNTFAL